MDFATSSLSHDTGSCRGLSHDTGSGRGEKRLRTANPFMIIKPDLYIYIPPTTLTNKKSQVFSNHHASSNTAYPTHPRKKSLHRQQTKKTNTQAGRPGGVSPKNKPTTTTGKTCQTQTQKYSPENQKKRHRRLLLTFRVSWRKGKKRKVAEPERKRRGIC